MAELIPNITEVAITDVIVRDRLRPVSEAGVAALLASIGELGVIKDPIHVRRKKDGSLHLMAGGHRLQAAKALGWQMIPAKVWTCSDDWARMMEIDDNLAGAELTALDTAVFLARRKEVYERLHPETRATTGAALVARRWDTAEPSSAVSFAAATAEKLGISERQVRKMVEAGRRLGPDELAKLRRAPRPVTLKDLIVIAKVDAPTRYHIVGDLAEGRAKSAAAALSARKAKDGGKDLANDPVEGTFKALRDAWSRAPMAARRRFVEAEEAVLGQLLNDLHYGDDGEAEE